VIDDQCTQDGRRSTSLSRGSYNARALSLVKRDVAGGHRDGAMTCPTGGRFHTSYVTVLWSTTTAKGRVGLNASSSPSTSCINCEIFFS